MEEMIIVMGDIYPSLKDRSILVNNRYIYGIKVPEMMYLSFEKGEFLDVDTVQSVHKRINSLKEPIFDDFYVDIERVMSLMSYYSSTIKEYLIAEGFDNELDKIVATGFGRSSVYLRSIL